jgi:RHH-type rel operon transcriptional repressor/antitoxin RelB
MTLKALPIKVSEEIYNRLDRLAHMTHRTKTFYVREALNSYLEDLEDTYLALQRLEKPGKIYSNAEAAKILGLNDDEGKESGLDN